MAIGKACCAIVTGAAKSHLANTKGASSADRKKADRIYKELSSSAEKFLRCEAPDCVSIWTDPKNGRWKMCMKGVAEARRSISWTNMGEQDASIVVLRQAWGWVEQFGGRCMPAHMTALFETRGSKQRTSKTYRKPQYSAHSALVRVCQRRRSSDRRVKRSAFCNCLVQ